MFKRIKRWLEKPVAPITTVASEPPAPAAWSPDPSPVPRALVVEETIPPGFERLSGFSVEDWEGIQRAMGFTPVRKLGNTVIWSREDRGNAIVDCRVEGRLAYAVL